MTAMPVPQAPVRERRRPGQGVRLCLGMLRGALVGGHLCLVAALAAGWATRGATGAANAAIGGALVMVFFATGQAVQMLAAEMADSSGMALLMASYLLRVLALAGVLWAAMAHQDRLEQVFDRTTFFAGAMACLAGWIGGILVAHSRQHVHVYDRDAESDGGVA